MKDTAKNTIRIWMATDSIQILGTYATCLFFGRKPALHDGIWDQKDRNGRWPIVNTKNQSPGTMQEVDLVKFLPLHKR